MPSAAIIEHLVFALRTSSPPVGKALAGRVSQLFHSELQQIITEEFELAELANPTTGSRYLPQLVLELEPVAAGRIEQDLPARLRTALRQTLAALPRSASGELPGEATLLTGLRHFLLFGHLPWQADAAGFEPDRVVTQALREHRGALHDLLRRVGHQAGPRQRLVRQLSAATLAQLIGLLEPVYAASVLAYVQGLEALHGQQPLVPATLSALRYVVLEAVVVRLLNPRPTLFNEVDFVADQLVQLAARYHLSYQALVQWLVQGIVLAPVAPLPASASIFTRIIRALNQENSSPGLNSSPSPGFINISADPGRQSAHLLSSTRVNAPVLLSGPMLGSWSSNTPLAAAATSRLLGPLAGFRPASPLRLAVPATTLEAQEVVFAYLLHGRAHPARVSWLRSQLRRAVSRHPTAVTEFLRRYRAVPGVATRLALVADFAILEHLRPRAHSAHRPRLAALDALTTSPAGGQRLAAFLKALFVAFHYSTSGRWSVATPRQLAAAHGLPWEKTLLQLAKLRADWPALVAAPFFRHFWALLPVTPPAAGQLSRPPASPNPVRSPQREPLRLPNTAEARPRPNEPEETQLALIFRYLLHGPAAGDGQPAAALRHTFQLATRQPSPLREFLRQHAHNRAVQQHLAHLADFSALHKLVASPGPGRRQRQEVRLALAALDRRLHQSTRPGPTRFGLFLREAYSAFTLTALSGAAATGTGVVDDIRQRAIAAGLSWRGVLIRVSWLLRQLPVLAADPFFGALLQASLGQTIRRRLGVPHQPAARLASTPRFLAAATARAELAWTILAQHIQGGQGQPAELLTQAIAELLRPGNGSLLERMYLYLTQPSACTYLATVLTREQFDTLLRALFPHAQRQLTALLRDWRRLHAQDLVQTSPDSALLWAEVLAVATTPNRPADRAAALVQSLMQFEQAHYRLGQQPTLLRLVQAIARQRIALTSPLAALLAAQLPSSPARLPSPRTQRPLPPALPIPFTKPPAAESSPAGAVYIANAGLVLLWPFFTMLFERASYLKEKAFKDLEAAERATHLLHFLVSGEENQPEHLLVLNKLLCGIERAQPLARVVPLTPEEKATCEGLFGAALGRWAALKNTSVAGLRETFLQRPGKLVWSPDKVTLTVETKTLDILLDQLPWSIGLIKLPWMALSLYVTWR